MLVSFRPSVQRLPLILLAAEELSQSHALCSRTGEGPCTGGLWRAATKEKGGTGTVSVDWKWDGVGFVKTDLARGKYGDKDVGNSGER